MLVIRVEFLRGLFEAGDADGPDRPEWPPSWMRVFSAFVDRAKLDEEAHILEALERLPRPMILASEAVFDRRGAFVPTNADESKDTTTLLRRIANERHWARAVPAHPLVEYHWPDESWGAEEHLTLSAIARRVPYLGRATSPAIVTIADEVPDVPAQVRTLVPYDPEAEGRFVSVGRVRRPFPGSLDTLRRIHDSSGDPWQVGVWDEYGVFEAPDLSPVSGPYQEFVVLRYEGRRLDGRSTAAITRYVKKVLMARIGDPPVAAVHGHHGGSTRQVAVVGLVDVGHSHADGHLMGLAVCIPAMDSHDLVRLATALPAAGEKLTVSAGRLGVLSFEPIPPARSVEYPFGLRPGRWTRPSTTWTTVLPLVSDRFLKPGDSVGEALRRMVSNAGLPPLRELIRWGRRPLVSGALDLHPRDTLRHAGDANRPYFHATFELERPVQGPVIVGSMRHYGLGLCVRTERDEINDG